MTTPAVRPSLGSDFTPSEVVVLYCDHFAPLPRQSRIAFEAAIAFPFLMGMLFATMLAAANDAAIAVRIIAGLVDLAIPLFWWLRRRKLDPKTYHGDIPVICPVDEKRMAVRDELVGTAVSAALLANERAGNMELHIESGELIARFSHSAETWPSDSLEDQLRRERAIPVSEVVYDWLADGSHFPFARASQLIEYCARRRGLQGKEPDASSGNGVKRAQAGTDDLARVEAMLNEARTQRPAVWKALQAAIRQGLKNREVPPRYEQVGQTQIPKYYYRELPIESLEATERDDGAPATPSAGSADEPLQKPNPLVQILILAVMVSGLLFALWIHPGNKTPALVDGGVLLLALLLMDFIVTRAWHRLRAVRQSYGLAAEPDGSEEERYRRLAESSTRTDKIAGWLIIVSIAALPGAIWGGWTVLIVLAFAGLFWLAQYWKLSQFKESAAPDIVRSRLARMAEREAVSAEPASTQSPSPVPAEAGAARVPEPSPSPRIPGQPTPAHELPPPSPGTREPLDRWSRRRRAFEHLQWKSFAVLITGYLAIVLAFWNSPGKQRWIDPGDSFTRYMPVIPFFILAATGMFLISVVARNLREGRSAVEEPASAEKVGFGVWVLIAIWRVLILLTTPILFGMGRQPVPGHHLAFAGTMLLFVAAHWGWTEWQIRGLLRAMPVPEPHRLVLLRVFGSPAFDDLVALIQPWRRVGCIEHLEGFDTVGRSENVIAAMDAGDIDRALVKTMPEIQAQFGSALYEPDRDLLFRRHAFQCTNTIWQEAVKMMLDRADAVLMDLSSLSFERQGCAWELGQLLDRVPLSKVTLLVNDNTDMECLREILQTAAQRIPASSPNRNSSAAWQLISIGGLSARQPDQSYHDWKRRLDQRLDSVQLATWLLSTAGSARSGRSLVNSSSEIRYWRQSWWAWLVLLILSAVWAAYLAGHFVQFG